MPGQTFVESGSVGFVGFTTSGWFEKFLFAPESHRHQARHIKRRAGGSDGSHDPNYPTHGNMSCRGGIPEYFIFGPKTAERNDAADCQPARHEGQVGNGQVFLESAHTSH